MRPFLLTLRIRDFSGNVQIFVRFENFFHQSVRLEKLHRLVKEFLDSEKYVTISEKSWFFWYAYYTGRVTKYVRPAETLRVTLKASRQKKSYSRHIHEKVLVAQRPQTKGCLTPRASYLWQKNEKKGPRRSSMSNGQKCKLLQNRWNSQVSCFLLEKWHLWRIAKEFHTDTKNLKKNRWTRNLKHTGWRNCELKPLTSIHGSICTIQYWTSVYK